MRFDPAFGKEYAKKYFIKADARMHANDDGFGKYYYIYRIGLPILIVNIFFRKII